MLNMVEASPSRSVFPHSRNFDGFLGKIEFGWRNVDENVDFADYMN
jgi:hypothetical protein